MCNRRTLVTIVAGLTVAACVGAGPATFYAPKLIPQNRNLRYSHNVQLFGLTNGLLVAVAPEPNTNLVKVDVRYKVGAAEDPPGKAGLAHLVEHVLFTVRAKTGGPTLGDELSDVALFHNAYTNWDETHFTSTAHSQNVMRLLEIEHKRMATTCAHIDEKLVRREQLVVKQELLQRGIPNGDVVEPLRVLLFGADHAYARSVAGTTTQVMALTLKDVCTFIEDHYAPNRAILVISGNVAMDKLRQPVGRMFGPMQRRAKAERKAIRAFLPGKRSRLALAVEDHAVVLAFDASAWGTSEELNMRVLTDEVHRHLVRLSSSKPFVTRVSMSRLGGFSGGAIGFAISVTSPKHIPDALRLFELARHDAIKSLDHRPVMQALSSRWNARVLRDVEPFQRRAVRIADYLQYAPTKQLMLADLHTLKRLNKGILSKLAATRLNLAAAHIVRVRPSAGGSRAKLRVSAASKRYEIELWRHPVDESDADKPLHVPAQKQRLTSKRFVLKNGLEVILVPKLAYPLIDVRLVFPVGTVNDPPGKRGTASLAARLLQLDYDRRYPIKAHGAIKWIIGMGGVPDTEVGDHSTSFHIRGMSIYADGLLWQLHWRLIGGVYTQAAFKSMRAAIGREQASQKAARRYERLIHETIYGRGHPYSESYRPPMLHKIKLDDLRRFHKRHYRAPGATLIVTGKFDSDDVEARIKRLFSRLPGGRPQRIARVPAAFNNRRTTNYALLKPDAVQPRVLLAFRAVPGFRRRHAHRLVLAQIVRQRTAAIRARFGASYGVRVGYTRNPGPNVLTISAGLDPNHSGNALAAILTGLKELRAGKKLKRAFVRARRKVLEKVLAASVDSDSAGDNLEMISTYRLPRNYFRIIAREVARLRLGSIRALIRQELRADRSVIVALGTRAGVKKLFRGAGIKNYVMLK